MSTNEQQLTNAFNAYLAERRRGNDTASVEELMAAWDRVEEEMLGDEILDRIIADWRRERGVENDGEQTEGDSESDNDHEAPEIMSLKTLLYHAEALVEGLGNREFLKFPEWVSLTQLMEKIRQEKIREDKVQADKAQEEKIETEKIELEKTRTDPLRQRTLAEMWSGGGSAAHDHR